MSFATRAGCAISATALCSVLCGTIALPVSSAPADAAQTRPPADQERDRGGDDDRGGDRDHGGRDDHERARVVTYHNDVRRTGWNRHERILSPQTVNQTTFGLLKTVVLADPEDQVDAEPLLVDGVEIDHRRHDVVYVVTENDTVYAIDAESGAVLKSRHLGTPVPRPLNCENNGNAVGINSTPTIDVATRTLYLIAYRMEGASPVHELHALDLATLNDKPHSPIQVAAANTLKNGSTYSFDSSVQRQRPALLQANGNIYAGFGSFCDFKAAQSRGWVLGWNQATLQALGHSELPDKVLAPSSTFDCYHHTPWTSNHPCYLSSIWMSGFGLASDEKGHIYFTTGNTTPGIYDSTWNLAESVIKLSDQLDKVDDFFTPADENGLDWGDTDFGSGGALVLPDQPGPMPHLVVAAGKEGNLFIMNRDTGKMGGFNSPNKSPSVWVDECWCGPSYFEGADGIGRVVSSGGSQVRVWKVNTAASPALSQEGAAAIDAGQDGGFLTSVSSNGRHHDSAIIWAVSHALGSDSHLELYAFNAKAAGGTLATLWSGEAGSWPNNGGNANIVPMVANGRVYVASYQELQIFGLLDREHPHGHPEERRAHPPAPAASLIPASGPLYWGTIRKVEGRRIELELRNGSRLTVDVSKVVPSASSDTGAVGHTLAISGTMGADKVFVASGLWRIKRHNPWGPDRER
jgi:hypothetical protein